jgi:hypothetical protein
MRQTEKTDWKLYGWNLVGIVLTAILLFIIYVSTYGFYDYVKRDANQKAPGTYVVIEDGIQKRATYTLNQDGTVDFKSVFDSAQGTWKIENIPWTMFLFRSYPDLVINIGPDRWTCSEYQGHDNPVFRAGQVGRLGDTLNLERK